MLNRDIHIESDILREKGWRVKGETEEATCFRVRKHVKWPYIVQRLVPGPLDKQKYMSGKDVFPP